MSASNTVTSAFLEALGADAERLDPRLRSYFAGTSSGDVVCTGVFSVAGSRFGRAGLLGRPLLGPELVIAAYGRDVPFRVINREVGRVEGGSRIHAERVLRFGRRTERFTDLLRRGPEPGTLINELGRARRVHLLLRCAVTDEGFLRIRSVRTWFVLRGLRIRLPRTLGVEAELLNAIEPASGALTVDARVWNPLAGTVTEYRGSFVVEVTARDDAIGT